MINEALAKIFPKRRLRDQCRYIVHRQELVEYWQDMSLIEKERMLCISDPKVLEILGNNIRNFLTDRKFLGCYPAYNVKDNGQYQISVYDCIVCRCIASDQNTRELVSSFLLILKHRPEAVSAKLHEVVDNQIIQSSIIKVKASYILRLVSFLDHFLKEAAFEGQKIIINPSLHWYFMMNWLNRMPIKSLDDYVRELFVGFLVLLENQIIAGFLQSQDIQAIRKRRFTQPAKFLMKPRNNSCFTTTNEAATIGRVQWASLTVSLLQLKYRIVQKPDMYVCYKDQQQAFDSQSDPQDDPKLSVQDYYIVTALRQYRWMNSMGGFNNNFPSSYASYNSGYSYYH